MLRRAARAASLALLLFSFSAPLAAAPKPLPKPTPATAAPALAEAARLHTEVAALTEQAHYSEALPKAERALSLREKAEGPDHPDVAESLVDLAEILVHRAEYARATPLHRRALAIREKALGPEDISVAESLIDLGSIAVSAGHYDDAEPLFARALAIREKKLKSPHKLIAETLGDLAAVYYYQAKYDLAEPLFERALAAAEAALGKDDLSVALVAGNLASLHDKLGHYDAAEPLYRRALAIREKALGPDHPTVAGNLNNLGVFLENQGDYLKAVDVLERSLAIREKALGPDHPEVADSLHNLAAAYDSLGEPERAEPLYTRALGIFEKTVGPSHPHTLNALQSLAILLVNQGDLRAEGYVKRLLDARSKEIETGDPQAAETMYILAQLAGNVGFTSDTRSLAQRVLKIFEKTYGPEHPFVARTLVLLAATSTREGDLARAEELYRRAVAIAEKSEGPHHPDLGRFLAQLSAVVADRRRVPEALELAARAAEIEERNLRVLLGAGSQAQKQRYAALFTADTEGLVALHQVRAPADARATRLGLLAILRRKGRAVDAAADGVGALRKRLTAEDARLLDDLAEARGAIAQRMLTPPEPRRPRVPAEDLEARAARIEAEISRRSAAFREAEAPVTVEAVQARIPEGAALVEIFVRRPGPRGALPRRYAAYVLGHSGDPTWVDLGEARPINAAVTALRDALSRPTSTDARARARDVDALTLQPIRKLLGGARQIFFAPDGQLDLLPVNALVDEDGRYLIEGYAITYLTSGRDLLRPPRAGVETDAPVIIADPAFGPMTPASSTAPRGGGLEDLQFAIFPPLPGTAAEAKALSRLLPGARLLTQAEATEEALKGLHRPRLLHIATHGFFLSDDEAAAAGMNLTEVEDLKKPRGHLGRSDALLRSGLAFAGANQHRTLRGSAGILTALEASALDLWGTKLVVLSACETGLGAVETGEGVNGLRRALLLAGAESAVMSLWKVDDEATRQLMIGMYDRLTKGGGRTEALREAQLEMLGKKGFAHPYFWASFIPSGDDRALSGEAPRLRFDRAPAGRVTPGARGCACEAASAEAPGGWGLAALGAAVAMSVSRSWRRCRQARSAPLRPPRRRPARRPA